MKTANCMKADYKRCQLYRDHSIGEKFQHTQPIVSLQAV